MLAAAKLTSWLGYLAPELASTYVVFTGTLPPDSWGKADLLGVTTAKLDLSLRQHLSWHGRAPCIVINDAAAAEEAAGLVAAGFGPSEAELFAFGRVALHEASHVLHRPPPYYDTDDRPPAFDAAAIGALLAAPDHFIAELSRLSGGKVAVGGDHGPLFHRLACHLAARAQRSGCDIRAGAVVPDMYGLPAACHCAAVLAGEVQQMAGWPIESVKAAEPPAEYASLWG